MTLWQQRNRLSVRPGGIDPNVDRFRFRNLQYLAIPLRLDGDVHGDGCLADANQPGQKADNIPHQNGLFEFHAIHGHGYDQRMPTTGKNYLATGSDGTGLVNVRKDNTAEDAPKWVRISRHHDDLNSQIRFDHEKPFLSGSDLQTITT